MITVTSGAAKTRSGGPHVPVPGLRYSHEPSDSLCRPGRKPYCQNSTKWNGKICLLTTDNHGKVTGIYGGGALWVSEDGMKFNPAWTQLGYDRIPAYYKEYDAQKVRRVYGRAAKLERPKVLMIDNQPAYLYAPSGWAVHGGSRTVSYVLRINLPDDAGPVPSTAKGRE